MNQDVVCQAFVWVGHKGSIIVESIVILKASLKDGCTHIILKIRIASASVHIHPGSSLLVIVEGLIMPIGKELVPSLNTFDYSIATTIKNVGKHLVPFAIRIFKVLFFKNIRQKAFILVYLTCNTNLVI